MTEVLVAFLWLLLAFGVLCFLLVFSWAVAKGIDLLWGKVVAYPDVVDWPAVIDLMESVDGKLALILEVYGDADTDVDDCSDCLAVGECLGGAECPVWEASVARGNTGSTTKKELIDLPYGLEDYNQFYADLDTAMDVDAELAAKGLKAVPKSAVDSLGPPLGDGVFGDGEGTCGVKDCPVCEAPVHHPMTLTYTPEPVACPPQFVQVAVGGVGSAEGPALVSILAELKDYYDQRVDGESGSGNGSRK